MCFSSLLTYISIYIFVCLYRFQVKEKQKLTRNSRMVFEVKLESWLEVISHLKEVSLDNPQLHMKSDIQTISSQDKIRTDVMKIEKKKKIKGKEVNMKPLTAICSRKKIAFCQSCHTLHCACYTMLNELWTDLTKSTQLWTHFSNLKHEKHSHLKASM